MMPKGAQAMTQRTTLIRASAMLESTFLVFLDAARRAMPRSTAQVRMPMKLALAMAPTGLETALVNSVSSTCPMPEGAEASAPSMPVRVRVVGKSTLKSTATAAATKVEMMYMMTTDFMAPEVFALARALTTRKKTKMGAAAFRALTKRVPSRGTMTKS